VSRWYWGSYDGLRLTMHLRTDWTLVWTHVRGVQIGPWFVGAIKGVATEQDCAPVQRTSNLDDGVRRREVNDCRQSATASQTTHEARSSTLTPDGGFPANWRTS
jgi:hypothetical protein